MPWWCSSVVALALVASACIGTATVFQPEPGAERLSTFQLRDRADGILREECPRLLGGRGSGAGESQLRAEVNRQGSVTRATMLQSSGDERMDRLFGSLAARLQFDALPAAVDATVTRVWIGFSCGQGGEAVTTVRVGSS